MDKHLIRERFARAIPTYDRHAVVQRHIACRMAELLDEHLPSSAHRRVWEVGCGTGLFTRAYLKQHTPDDYLLNDLCPEMERTLADLLNERTRFTAGDAEQTAPDGQVSLITSCSSLQWFEEPLRFLETCHAYLNRDGYLAFTLFGEDNFHELRDIANASLPYHPLGYWLEAATQRGYRPALAKEEHTTQTFSSPKDVLQHLKQTGVTGIRRETWTKGQLIDFIADYARLFTTPDGQVTLTYHPIYIILKRQQT